jgi:hypothetical protein
MMMMIMMTIEEQENVEFMQIIVMVGRAAFLQYQFAVIQGLCILA